MILEEVWTGQGVTLLGGAAITERERFGVIEEVIGANLEVWTWLLGLGIEAKGTGGDWWGFEGLEDEVATGWGKRWFGLVWTAGWVGSEGARGLEVGVSGMVERLGGIIRMPSEHWGAGRDGLGLGGGESDLQWLSVWPVDKHFE